MDTCPHRQAKRPRAPLCASTAGSRRVAIRPRHLPAAPFTRESIPAIGGQLAVLRMPGRRAVVAVGRIRAEASHIQQPPRRQPRTTAVLAVAAKSSRARRTPAVNLVSDPSCIDSWEDLTVVARVRPRLSPSAHHSSSPFPVRCRDRRCARPAARERLCQIAPPSSSLIRGAPVYTQGRQNRKRAHAVLSSS